MSSSKTIANRYLIQDLKRDLLGQGAMGEVYLGRDTQTQASVAIKILRAEAMGRDAHVITRFQREGEVLRQLNHPNIVKMLDAVAEDDTYCLVMEYVSGGTLRGLLTATPRLSVEKTVNIALDMADALTRTHRLQIIHRDLKPSNILMAEDGTPRLTDFGIARVNNEVRLTQTGMVVGTVAYLAPEGCRGQTPDERSDIWSLGVILYEMLAGQHPFGRIGSVTSMLLSIISDPIPDITQYRTDLPFPLVALLKKMLIKEPEKRLNSARRVGAQLEEILRLVEKGDWEVAPPPTLTEQDTRVISTFDKTSVLPFDPDLVEDDKQTEVISLDSWVVELPTPISIVKESPVSEMPAIETPEEEATRLRHAGIQALKAGQLAQARILLRQSLEQDENSVTTWLWLSGAVESKEDKQLCLEMALALDPYNKVAQKGLNQLGITYNILAPEKPEPDPDPIPEPVVETSPEPVVGEETLSLEVEPEEPPYEDWSAKPPPAYQPPPVALTEHEPFNDVWDREAEICAYCAREVTPKSRRCPKCRRRLSVSILAYEKPNSYFYIFLGVLGLNILRTVLNSTHLVSEALLVQFANGYGLPSSMGLITIGYVMVLVGSIGRYYWAYRMVLLLLLAEFFLQFVYVERVPSSPLDLSYYQMGYLLFMGFVILAVGNNFKQTRKRYVAFVDRALTTADQLDRAGKKFAKQGMWATAILHWRRAVAQDPAHTAYLRRLAQGYAKLGFYERGVDTLQYAQKMSHSFLVQTEIDKEIDALQKRIK